MRRVVGAYVIPVMSVVFVMSMISVMSVSSVISVISVMSVMFVMGMLQSAEKIGPRADNGRQQLRIRGTRGEVINDQ